MRSGNATAAAAAFEQLRGTLDKLADLPRKLAAASAEPITKLLQAQYRAGTDPYGRAWRKLRPSTLARGRHPPPLTDTGRMREGTRARVLDGNRAGLHIVVGAPYGAFHQVGFRVGRTKVGPRKILPSRGIPSAWAGVFRQQAQRLAREASRA